MDTAGGEGIAPVGMPGQSPPAGARHVQISSVDALLLGIVVVLVVVLTHAPMGPAHALLAFATALLLARPRRPLPDRPLAWVLFAVAASFAGFGSLAGSTGETPLVDLVLTAVAGTILLSGTYLFGRHRDGHASGPALVDALALGLSAALLLWATTALHSGSGIATFISPVELGFDVAALAQVLYLNASRRHRSTALRLLAAGLAVAAVDDLLSALAVARMLAVPDEIRTVLGALPYVLWSAAALDPSRRVLGAGRALSRAFTIHRVLVGGVAVLLDPLLVVAVVRRGDLALLPPLVVLHVALVALVLARMAGMSRRLGAQAQHLRRIVDLDPLTGLESDRRFAERLADLLSARGAVTGPAPRFVLGFGCGGLAELNETLGREVADDVLVAAAAAIREALGEDPVVARTGAGEFAALLPAGTTELEAESAAHRVRSRMSGPLTVNGLNIPTDLAVGVVPVTPECRDARTVLRRVGHTIAAARQVHSGVTWFGPAVAEGAVLAADLMSELAEAIGAGQLVVHYQPQVDLVTGRVAGVEALVRWRHPTHGLLAPGAFLPAAERTGAMRLLTLVVLDQAVAQCAAWDAEGRDLGVAVNLSARNLVDPRLVDDVRAILGTYRFPPERLELEITETAAMVDPAYSAAVLAGLAGLGVRLAVDDYGTGYGSLAYLQQLPVSRLKIDRSFVAAIGTDPVSTAIVRSTVELAHEVGLGVVAEGVESDEVLAALRSMHCDVAQGFGLGRPVPASQAVAEFDRIEASWDEPAVPHPRAR